MPEPNNSRRKPFEDYLKYSAIGFQMLAIILVGVFLGYKFDQWFPIADFPLFMTLFSLVFVCIAMFIIIRMLIKGK